MKLLAVALAVLALACERQPRVTSPAGNLTERHQVTERRAGPPRDTPPRAVERAAEPDEETLSEGRTLYNQYNCSGCHAAGGGAIGPALIDNEWIYGDGLDNIFYTIVEGRPQGMPAYRGRIPDGQIRTIAQYVKSLAAEETAPEGSSDAAAGVPASTVERGREVFLQGPCAVCHTIRGTRALATVGPDLTHVASRTRIAGGLLENTRGNLAGWILNPQNLKPGTKMPPTLLEAEELHALLDYLESLE